MIKINVFKIYMTLFTFAITIVPIKILGIRIFNEVIFILSMFNIFLLFTVINRFDKTQLMIFLIGIFFSSMFFLSFLINIPDVICIKDFVESLKPMIYSLIIIGGYTIKDYFSEKGATKYIIILSVISIIFSLLVFFPPLYGLLDIYKGRSYFEDYNIHFFRFSGFMGYPGPFGYWLVLGFLLILNEFYKKNLKFLYFFALYVFLIFGIIFTGSRGALLIFFLTTLSFLILNLKLKRNIFSLLLVSISLFICICLIFKKSENIKVFKLFLEPLQDFYKTSFVHRMNEIGRVVENIRKGILLGVGPSNILLKNELGPIETALFFYIYKFGIFGLLYYSIIIFLNFWIFIKSKKLTLAKTFSLWSILVLTIGSLNESITEEYKSFYMYFTLLGFCIGDIKNFCFNRETKLFSQNKNFDFNR